MGTLKETDKLPADVKRLLQRNPYPGKITTTLFNFDNNNSEMNNKKMPIELRDNNSQFISKIPKELVEPLILIATIKGFDSGIDDYIVDLIEND